MVNGNDEQKRGRPRGPVDVALFKRATRVDSFVSRRMRLFREYIHTERMTFSRGAAKCFYYNSIVRMHCEIG